VDFLEVENRLVAGRVKAGKGCGSIGTKFQSERNEKFWYATLRYLTIVYCIF
jgi:hypothetical protein